ncbi:MAG: hypothetical protein IT580_05815 [Verrucomicrobiales bacterium]|nr:hypothetical protein [Verrucomicrobiales bacterium]
MNPQIFSLALITCCGLGLVFAARRGHAMPISVCLVLVILGSLIAMAPTAFSFVLQVNGRQPQFSQDEIITCWVLGGTMTVVGAVASVVSHRVAGRTAPRR